VLKILEFFDEDPDPGFFYPGSGLENSDPGWKNSDPGWKNSDPGFGINIPDPKNCSLVWH
jgi:hypothetical protein